MPFTVDAGTWSSANIPPTDFALQASANSANGPAGASKVQLSALER
jgi:hypothetical protein